MSDLTFKSGLRTLISEYIFANKPASDITEILLGLILKKTASFEAVFKEYSVMPSMPRSCRVL